VIQMSTLRARNAPGWTGIVIGILVGLLAGSIWMLVRERNAHANEVALLQTGAAAMDPGPVAVPVSTTGPGTDRDADTISECRRTGIVQATELVAPAVVSINVIQHRIIRDRRMEIWDRFFPGMFPRREFRQDVQSLGSGVIVSDDGYVLTNFHVIEGGSEVIVTLSDGRQFNAEVLDAVDRYDLALLKIEGEDLPVAPMGRGDDLQIGEWAIAIGSPFGYLLADTQPTVTVGVVSALNRDIKQTDPSRTARNYLGMIQTDAAINPGNSGGPLVNAEGEVIGINTFIFSESGGSIGIGFAVPIGRARWLINEVREYGRYRQAYSGLSAQKLTPNIIRAFGLTDPIGFLVVEVKDDSPADEAGLRVRDIIRQIDGVPLETRDTVTRLLYEAKVGTQLEFLAERDGEPFTTRIVLEELPRSGAER